MKLYKLPETEIRSVLSVMGKQDAICVGRFYCVSNKLTSLEGAPTSVSGNFWCSNNKLTSLEGIHKQIKKINGKFTATSNLGLTSHLLGLILIDGITEIKIDNKDIEEILNRHLQQPNKK